MALFSIINNMNIFGIESSCDETSAAVNTDGMLRSNVISSQFVHQKYGGVVPELASREHQKMIVPIVNAALAQAKMTKTDIDGIAVTYGPGLVGSLLIGLSFAKALAYSLNVPFVGVNHLEGHLYSSFLSQNAFSVPEYPFICLTVSGGHTQIILVREPFDHTILGQTQDDAAGEAFDKVAKMLNLGYPGGPVIDKFASKGNPEYVIFPRSLIHEDNFDFSFSGLKTSVLYYLRDHDLLNRKPEELGDKLVADLCASFQAAVVEILVTKTIKAARIYGVKDIAVAGGVSANTGLRAKMTKESAKYGLRVHIPSIEYCTDNAAMVALVGWMKLSKGIQSPFTLQAIAHIE